MKQQELVNKQEEKTRIIATELFMLYNATFIKERGIKSHTDMLVDFEKDGHIYQYNVELKVRNCKSTDYSDMLITELKVYHLFTDFQYRSPMYVVFYDDCTYIWDLSLIEIKDLKKVKIKSNKVTMTDNPIKVEREFLLLPLDKGLRLDFNYKNNLNKLK